MRTVQLLPGWMTTTLLALLLAALSAKLISRGVRTYHAESKHLAVGHPALLCLQIVFFLRRNQTNKNARQSLPLSLSLAAARVASGKFYGPCSSAWGLAKSRCLRRPCC